MRDIEKCLDASKASVNMVALLFSFDNLLPSEAFELVDSIAKRAYALCLQSLSPKLKRDEEIILKNKLHKLATEYVKKRMVK